MTRVRGIAVLANKGLTPERGSVNLLFTLGRGEDHGVAVKHSLPLSGKLSGPY